MSILSEDRDAEIAAILASTPAGLPKKKEPAPEEKKPLTDEEVLQQILNPPPPPPEPIVQQVKLQPVPQVSSKDKYKAIKSAMREKEEQQNRENQEQMKLLKRQLEISEPLAPAEPVPQPEKVPVISGVTVEQSQPLKEPETFTSIHDIPKPEEISPVPETPVNPELVQQEEITAPPTEKTKEAVSDKMTPSEPEKPSFTENDPFFSSDYEGVDTIPDELSFMEEPVSLESDVDDFREEPPVREYIPKKERTQSLSFSEVVPEPQPVPDFSEEPAPEQIDEPSVPPVPMQKPKPAPKSKKSSQPAKKEKSDAPVKKKKTSSDSEETSVKKTKKKKKKKSLGQRFIELFPQKGDDAFEIVRKLIFLASAIIFIICIGLIGKYFYDNYKNQQMNTAVSDIYNPTATESPEDATEPPTMVNEEGETQELFLKLPTVDNLLSINPDVVGWIHIPDTPIDYAVLQHRDPETANNYYLDKNIYLQSEKAGSIFLDYRANFDVVEEGTAERARPNSQNLIIYGHNMHDYSMFGSLKRYINEEDFYDSHPIIYLNSNYREYQYKVFGMIIVDIADNTETAFDYWNTLNFPDEEKFYDYVNEVKRRTVRLTDVDVTYGDQILTLSTCNSTFSEGRLVVFARLVRDGEDPKEGCTSVENPNIKWPNSYYKWRKNTYDPNAAFEPYG